MKLKKLNIFILSVIMIFSALIAPASAEPEITVNTATVSVANAPENSNVITALYKDNNLTAVKIYNGSGTITAPYAADMGDGVDKSDTIKVFIWNMDTITPVAATSYEELLSKLPMPANTSAPTNTPLPSITPLPSNTPTPTNTPAPSSTPIPEDDGNNVLVAYFSFTSNTEKIAGYAADYLSADLHEIVPKVAYTDADKIYYDQSSRAYQEQNNSSARPEISSVVENMDKYDIVFLGYPIWYGQAPKIMYSFLESYDFEGKTIVPFCTSASSGIGTSATNMHSSAQGANWLNGTRFSSGSSRDNVVSWINGLGLDLTAK